jgi:hypothetical protein
MRHFVAYHNSDKMGYEDSDPTGLYTSKSTSQTGDLIWIVTGSGKSPKRYSLTSWFIVSEIEQADDPRFGLSVRGTEGGALEPAPALNGLPWFQDFFKRMAHFSLGLHEITERKVIRSLTLLAASANRPLPNLPGIRQQHDGTHKRRFSADDYVRAFRALLKNGLAEKHVALLKGHFSAPRHTVTWPQLAKAVGYVNGSTVHLQYGALARRVADELGVPMPRPGFWLYLLVDWAKDQDPKDQHTAFVLRRPVIHALTRLGLFQKRASQAAGTSTTDDLQELHLTALEGDCHRAEAMFRSRNRKLIAEKKRLSQGKCTVCEFDFNATYQGLKRDLLVAHHAKPIGKRTKATRTMLEDIDVLCPNCHAAVHPQDPPLSAGQLRQRLVS